MRDRSGWCRWQSSGGIDNGVVEGHGGVPAQDQPVGELGVKGGRGVRRDGDAVDHLKVAHDGLEVTVAGRDDLGDVRSGVDEREGEQDLPDELDQLKVTGRGRRVSQH